MKRKVALVFAVASVVAGVGCGGSDNSSSTKNAVSQVPCEPKGINAEQGATGTCARNGVTYTVANKGQTLQLDQLDAKLIGFKTSGPFKGTNGNKAQPRGTYVIVTLQVKNKTDKDQRVGGPGFEQTMLADSHHQYLEDATANSLAPNSFVTKGKVSAGKTETGEIYFDVPDDFAKNLVKNKTDFVIANFSDADRLEDTKRLGVIRMWKGPSGTGF
jgi:hypothetical protein